MRFTVGRTDPTEGFSLRFSSEIWKETQDSLFSTYEQETKCFLLCNAVEGPITVLLPIEVVHVPLSAYAARSRVEVVIKPDFILELLESCEKRSLSLLEAHTHPWSDDVAFSPIDLASDPKKFAVTEQLPAPFRHASIVLGKDRSFDGHIWNAKTKKTEPLLSARVIESPVKELQVHGQATAMAIQQLGFDRQVELMGSAGQQSLARLKIGIVGCGGLGTQVAQALGYLGVRDFTLVDPDALERSNSNRVVGIPAADCEAGLSKVDALCKSLNQIFGHEVKVNPVANRVQEQSSWRALQECDLICSAPDSVAARQFLNRFACAFLIPIVDGGCGLRAKVGRLTEGGGQVQVISPGDSACRSCLPRDPQAEVREHLMSEQMESNIKRGYIEGADLHAPQVVFLNGVIGNLMAWEVVKLITGCADSIPYTYYDLLHSRVFPVEDAVRNDDCSCCSIAGWLASGSDHFLASTVAWDGPATIPTYGSGS